MKSIKVTVSKLGSPTIEAIGFNGVGCKKATKNLEDALSDSDIQNNVIEKPEMDNVDMESEDQYESDY